VDGWAWGGGGAGAASRICRAGFFCFRFVFSFRPVAAGGAKASHRRLASRYTLTASQGNAAKPGGRARRPCLRQTPLVELYSGEPALTRDAGCRSASLVWTRAQLHYLTKRQQRNVDNETTYKTTAMKQPKRSGLAWSHGRDAALLRAVSSRSSTTWQRRSSPQSGVVTLFDNRDMVEPSFCPPLSPRSAISHSSMRRHLAALASIEA
jgi:hypothetical protein